MNFPGTINNDDDGDSGNVTVTMTVMMIKDLHIPLNFTQLPYFSDSEHILFICSF